ncbi:2,3-diphosphoglycerate-dependent phosphoglycerate mutase [Polaribacter litorisediminis]|uniref:2,3-diphosphoglycerate-dependent phosphoglycerate mutase n=1 Tax=Polaribacter litorisediminis TaxID=1908341 RepID=UPI001CC0F0EA|nr:2,3-diphosphoglycerate-dependent phosphoglycerate mutase [Polaribacter litorisediminis]UAM98173.1 2,3-diphosphoglycerate-dependent phosphoglycerate mutase [Polaribacter litorisediminis]
MKNTSYLSKLVLLRHGESEWNKQHIFTGWTDIDLSDRGKQEALYAARILEDHDLVFDVAFTSLLKRAIRSLWIVLDEMQLMWIRVHKDWRLNERNYGELQGLNKGKITMQYGEQQVFNWRRSYDIRPPALAINDARHPCHDFRYKNLLSKQLPSSESLKDTMERLLPYWHLYIAPELKMGKTVLIVGHGNNLRALIKYLDSISESEIIKTNIPRGIPLIYELDHKLKPITHYYLSKKKSLKNLSQQINEL